jgi:hypothetical protein
MTTRRDTDTLIAAFFDQVPPELPDRAFDAVRREIHRVRQRVVLWPFGAPAVARRRIAFAAAVAAIALLAGVLGWAIGPGRHATVSPTGPAPSGPAGTARPRASATRGASTASPFTSPVYGYAITLPAGWQVRPAEVHWTGTIQPGFGEVDVDSFTGPGRLSVAGFAGPVAGDLAALVNDRIAANARDHADTCPSNALEVNQPIRMAGTNGTLLGWNCGALINQAMTVKDGVAYVFSFRDLAIQLAIDPNDTAIFQALLDSVVLPVTDQTP